MTTAVDCKFHPVMSYNSYPLALSGAISYSSVVFFSSLVCHVTVKLVRNLTSRGSTSGNAL